MPQLLLRCDSSVVEMEVPRHLQESELHLSSITRCDYVVASPGVVELSQVRFVPNDRSAPTHLEAARRSAQVRQPIAQGIAAARGGREVLCNESEIRDWTGIQALSAAVSGASIDACGRRIAGSSPTGKV